MTPDQKLQYINLLRKAKSQNAYLTVDNVVNTLGVEHDEVKKSWYSEFHVSLVLENNFM